MDMRLVTGQEMKDIDRWAQKKLRISGAVLMENAGRGCVDILEKYFSLSDLKVMIFCGPGNNGGDGFVIGRHIKNRGGRVLAVLIGQEKKLKGDALINCRLARRSGMEIISTIKKEKILNLVRQFQPEVVIDALFGTGFQGPPKGIFSSVIEMINDLDAFVFAVDMPSGIGSDNGLEGGISIIADATATMCLPKAGNFLYPGRAYTGDLWLVDIGVPYSLINQGPLTLLTDREMKRLLPFRMPEGNKGTFGSVLVVAGARGFSGAAGMTARAALKVGAGLVRLAAPSGISDAVEAQLVEVVKISVPQTSSETFSYQALNPVLKWLEESDIAIIGPGITTHPDTKRFLKELINNVTVPFVLDADGLNNIADNQEILKKIKVPKILTPHPGELSRLINIPARKINENRIDIARKCAQDFNCIIVLKGAPTIIAGPDGNAFLNPTGNSGLATAGSGDVLVGMIGGFLAQGLTPVAASTLGVFLHGLAADFALKTSNEYSLMANDLFAYIPQALNHLIEEKYKDQDQNLLISAQQ